MGPTLRTALAMAVALLAVSFLPTSAPASDSPDLPHPDIGYIADQLASM